MPPRLIALNYYMRGRLVNGAAVVHHLRLYGSMIETITEEQLTPQQAEFWVRARQAVDMNNYPYAVSLLKAW